MSMARLYPQLEPYDRGMLDVGDGHQVYWETCGNPRGKPAVVFHGGPGSGCTPYHRRLFDPAIYRIVLFDQRGCGRSTRHASGPVDGLGTNTTWHLLADIELLRVHLGIDRWLVFGGSWGATLAILFAETHPERVTELILGGVTTTRRREVDWLYRGGVAPLLPGQWARFRAAIPLADQDEDPIEAYAQLLHDADPAVCDRAAEEWCRWETATISSRPGPALSGRFTDPRYALAFARIVTHYFSHDAWLEDGRLLRDTGVLADIPGIMVHGRLDLQSPLVTAWELKQAWPRADLVLVDEAGHASDEPGMTEQLVAATDRFAVH
jgi:proline iminopeptidase